MKVKKFTVLSLFDGMSCLGISLREIGISDFVYYTSEIDKWAIKQSKLNFPDSIPLGDVNNWREWEIDWSGIDLIAGGSPCQGFSMIGKQLAFDDPRSKLFFTFVDILNHIKERNPEVLFLLENVRMRSDYLNIITQMLGVDPNRIDAGLLSPQRRVRYYWTNINGGRIEQPEDRGLVLGDILEDNPHPKYNLTQNMTNYFIRNNQEMIDGGKNGFRFTPTWGDEKAKTITTKEGTRMTDNFIYLEGGGYRRLTPGECSLLQSIPSWYKWESSDTQIYKMLGNGWNVEVIKWILNPLKIKFKNGII
jgi:site-specific DNA-cytosine methylase